ncbi:hypothetical protein THALO_70118 [Tenacibaculum halocynthiae]
MVKINLFKYSVLSIVFLFYEVCFAFRIPPRSVLYVHVHQFRNFERYDFTIKPRDTEVLSNFLIKSVIARVFCQMGSVYCPFISLSTVVLLLYARTL